MAFIVELLVNKLTDKEEKLGRSRRGSGALGLP